MTTARFSNTTLSEEACTARNTESAASSSTNSVLNVQQSAGGTRFATVNETAVENQREYQKPLIYVFSLLRGKTRNVMCDSSYCTLTNSGAVFMPRMCWMWTALSTTTVHGNSLQPPRNSQNSPSEFHEETGNCPRTPMDWKIELDVDDVVCTTTFDRRRRLL